MEERAFRYFLGSGPKGVDQQGRSQVLMGPVKAISNFKFLLNLWNPVFANIIKRFCQLYALLNHSSRTKDCAFAKEFLQFCWYCISLNQCLLPNQRPFLESLSKVKKNLIFLFLLWKSIREGEKIMLNQFSLPVCACLFLLLLSFKIVGSIILGKTLFKGVKGKCHYSTSRFRARVPANLH